MYQSAALILRYVFVLAGVYMTARAVFMTVKDARRGTLLRSAAYKTGALAEFLYKDGRGIVRAYRLPREGLVGAGRNCDVRIPGVGLEKRHFYMEMINAKLRLTAICSASIGVERETPLEALEIAPGEYFFAGEARFRYIVLRCKARPLSPMTKRAYGGAIKRVLKEARQVK